MFNEKNLVKMKVVLRCLTFKNVNKPSRTYNFLFKKISSSIKVVFTVKLECKQSFTDFCMIFCYVKLGN